MEILVVALVAVGFWLVWRANKANDKINTTVAEEVKETPKTSEVEQRLWEQSVANVGKDEIKSSLTEEEPAKKPRAKKPAAKKTVATKKAPAKTKKTATK